METQEVARWIGGTLRGVVCKESWGEVAWFYNPGGFFANGSYFLTIKRWDGPNDKASRLDRDGVWRLNFGLPREQFEDRFGPRPARPPKGGVCDGPWDYAALDQLSPHPVYGWMGWVAINAPSKRTFEALKPLIREAHVKAKRGFETRTAKAA